MSQPSRIARPRLGWIRSEHLVLGLAVVLFLALAPFTPGLTRGTNLLNLLGYLLPLFVVAIGLTLVMITGGIDLSVTAIIALTSGMTLVARSTSAAESADAPPAINTKQSHALRAMFETRPGQTVPSGLPV